MCWRVTVYRVAHGIQVHRAALPGSALEQARDAGVPPNAALACASYFEQHLAAALACFSMPPSWSVPLADGAVFLAGAIAGSASASAGRVPSRGRRRRCLAHGFEHVLVGR